MHVYILISVETGDKTEKHPTLYFSSLMNLGSFLQSGNAWFGLQYALFVCLFLSFFLLSFFLPFSCYIFDLF